VNVTIVALTYACVQNCVPHKWNDNGLNWLCHSTRQEGLCCWWDDDAKHQVYVYDVNTDHWDQLPLSGHYSGVPHIIGGKLAIIGGALSDTIVWVMSFP